jgi:hypothetical protein
MSFSLQTGRNEKKPILCEQHRSPFRWTNLGVASLTTYIKIRAFSKYPDYDHTRGDAYLPNRPPYCGHVKDAAGGVRSKVIEDSESKLNGENIL